MLLRLLPSTSRRSSGKPLVAAQAALAEVEGEVPHWAGVCGGVADEAQLAGGEGCGHGIFLLRPRHAGLEHVVDHFDGEEAVGRLEEFAKEVLTVFDFVGVLLHFEETRVDGAIRARHAGK